MESTEHIQEQSGTALTAQLLDHATDSRALGQLGEQYATLWLQRCGWQLLAHNWHSRYGELDMVMLNTNHQIVVVEVKSRRSTRFGSPQEAITNHKQQAIRRAATQWIHSTHPLPRHQGLRFDVVTVLIRHGRIQLLHIPGAF